MGGTSVSVGMIFVGSSVGGSALIWEGAINADVGLAGAVDEAGTIEVEAPANTGTLGLIASEFRTLVERFWIATAVDVNAFCGVSTAPPVSAMR